MSRFKRAVLVLLGVEEPQILVAKESVSDAPDDLYELAVMALDRVSKEMGAFDEEDYDHLGHRVWRIISNGVFSERQQKELHTLYQKVYIERRREDARTHLMRVAMLGKEAFEDPANARTVLSAQGQVFRKDS